MKLNYVLPREDVPVVNTDVEAYSFTGYDQWLESIMAANRDTIFFYTTETTDIF